MLKIEAYSLDMEHFQALPSVKLKTIKAGIEAFDVLESQGFRWIRNPEGTVQSVMLLHEPAYPVLVYVQAMLCSLLFMQKPVSLLNFGLGSGSIERFILSQLPDIKLASVEKESGIVEIAKAHFHIPVYHTVITQSAQSYLKTNQTRYDILLSDICVRQGAANSQLTQEFVTHAACSLSSEGVFATNLMPNSESELVEVLVLLRKAFPWILIYEVPNTDNMVLFCTTQPPPMPVELIKRASALRQATGLNLLPICCQMIPLPEKG
jgi:spermidine synthase